MAEISVTGSKIGSHLERLLGAEAIEPGSEPGYELCKVIYTSHPLGSKIVDTPIQMAQSMPREIAVPGSPGERVVKAFTDKAKQIGEDDLTANLARQASIYGVSSIILGVKDMPSDATIDPYDLPKLHSEDRLFFNVVDPLNTAGSLVLDQDPNSPMFQKHDGVAVNGRRYQAGRACTLLNEKPVYIKYSDSAFGYVGRSVFQRALYPLKSFIQTMRADDMVARKAGIIVAALKAVSSAANRMMAAIVGIKRSIIKEAQTDNVISIGEGETVTTLDMANVDKALGTARRHVLENVASACPMPAIILNSQTFAEGFGEGTEDAKNVALFIDGKRSWMQPAYDWLDKIVMHLAWTPEFYATIQAEFPEEYRDVSYESAFNGWADSFQAQWPSLLKEPESKEVEVEDIKAKTIIAMLETMLPEVDPENKVRVIEWAANNLNENKRMFPYPLVLDYDTLREYTPPTPEPALEAPHEPRPFSAAA
ncbi:MAG TPA: anti-CBASS Acb1 family protein [Rhodopila sp.]